MAESPQHAVDNELEELLKKLGIREWDFLLFGDGSGTKYQLPCGWGSLVVRKGCSPMPLHGGFSNGTNITAEIMAVLHGLHYIWNVMLDGKPNFEKVAVVTDCRHVLRPELWSKHRDLAAQFNFYVRESLAVTIHWIDRNSTSAHFLCHRMANYARRHLQDCRRDMDANDAQVRALRTQGAAN